MDKMEHLVCVCTLLSFEIDLVWKIIVYSVTDSGRTVALHVVQTVT